jgi:hypothetical protein
MKARELVLLIPAVYLALSVDRLGPDRFRPIPVPVYGLDQAVPLLPAVNEGRFGRAGDPLNVVFVGTGADIRAALTAAGWTEVPTSLRGALAAGLMPMNDYRLIGRRQDLNWEISVRPFSERHHFRLWFTGIADHSARPLWWGSGNYDLSIRWADLSHRPDPDMDRERDFIVKTLAGSPFVQTSVLVRMPQIPLEGVNDKGYAYRTDGRAAVIALKRPEPARPAR